MLRGVALALVVTACGTRPAPARPGLAAASPCRVAPAPVDARDSEPIAAAADLAPYLGRTIAELEVVGAPHVGDRLRQDLEPAIGTPLTSEGVRDQLRRVWAAGLVDRAELVAAPAGDGVRVELRVEERGIVAGVDVAIHGAVRPALLRRLRALVGTIDDPERTARIATRLEGTLRAAGYAKARVAAERRPVADGAWLCASVTPGPRYVLATIATPGAVHLSRGRIAAIVGEPHTRLNRVGGTYRADLMSEAIVRLQNAYADLGFVAAQLGPVTTDIDDARGRITLRIPVEEGARYTLGAVKFLGVAPARQAAYRALLGAREGDVYRAGPINEGVQRIRDAERALGHAGDIWPMTEADRETHRITFTVDVRP